MTSLTSSKSKFANKTFFQITETAEKKFPGILGVTSQLEFRFNEQSQLTVYFRDLRFSGVTFVLAKDVELIQDSPKKFSSKINYGDNNTVVSSFKIKGMEFNENFTELNIDIPDGGVEVTINTNATILYTSLVLIFQEEISMIIEGYLFRFYLNRLFKKPLKTITDY